MICQKKKSHHPQQKLTLLSANNKQGDNPELQDMRRSSDRTQEHPLPRVRGAGEPHTPVSQVVHNLLQTKKL